ncbi:MAG: hypothetical protein J6Z43_02330, partial [Clostridiales bacterium]|nr:hypothetical protein [Clostridiales bacterium]
MSGQKQDRSPFIFLCALSLFMFSPLTLISTMVNMISDTAIQIRLGLDSISTGHLILDEIYSWHEGLIFTAHEAGWYVLVGGAYKLLGLAGVILVGAIFTYLTAFFCLKYSSSRSNPLIAAVVAVLVPFMAGFPDYSVRPSCVSLFALALFVYVYLTSEHKYIPYITFIVLCFALAWLHGGILPVFAAVMAFFAFIELIYRQWNKLLFCAASIALGFLVSLLNPIGIRAWTFGLKQSTASDIWVFVDEWNPKTFSVLEIILIALLLAGFALDKRIWKFDKESITRLGLLGMFLVATCIYKRFMLQFTVLYLMFAPEQITLLIKLLKEIILKVKKDISLSSSFYYLLSGICILFLGVTAFLRCPQYFHDNSMHDIEDMAAFDYGVIELAKSRDYKRPFNSFNTGSWLAFYGVPVHIDNRIDPYMSEYSGVDHIRGKIFVSSLDELDAFCSEYDCDAFILDMAEGPSQLISEIETSASDRYQIVYDNTVTSVDGLDTVRWVVIEPLN